MARFDRLRSFLAAAAILVAGASAAPAGLIIATNSDPGLFDESSGTRAVTFTGLESGFGSGIIESIQISINFAKADGEDLDPPYPDGTPYYNEIVFRLEKDATSVSLIDEDSFNSGDGPGFDGTILFTDAAADVVNVDPDQVQSGAFRPVSPLSAFLGQSALGTFTLYIEDTVGSDALRFRTYTLTIVTRDGAVVPEPSSIALVGVAGVTFATAYGWRRRRRRPTSR